MYIPVRYISVIYTSYLSAYSLWFVLYILLYRFLLYGYTYWGQEGPSSRKNPREKWMSDVKKKKNNRIKWNQFYFFVLFLSHPDADNYITHNNNNNNNIIVYIFTCICGRYATRICTHILVRVSHSQSPTTTTVVAFYVLPSNI